MSATVALLLLPISILAWLVLGLVITAIVLSIRG